MSEAEESSGDDGSAGAAAPAAGKSKMVPVLLAMNTVLMAGVLFMVLKKPADGSSHGKAEAPEQQGGEGEKGDEKEGPRTIPDTNKPGPVLALEPFVIQLRSADTERYVRITFNLEVGMQSDEEAIKVRLSPMRDSVIAYFSDRTLDELRGSDGLERVKQALLKRFDDLVPGRRIRNIYVTDFVMQ